ncbi:MAG: 2-C-methyl-D-erythritol 4-phosphate cytidylyltransferase [Methylacidiphilales bacterium]|nr:2-C-methyl-D-erythritol 4-phosphate cytidylyltransferase [Candidatus Methylacidiphilales bacterium]
MKASPSPAGRRLCALVPAAGRGTRLNADLPKAFVPILPDVTIWDAVRGKLSQVAAPIILVLSPEGLSYVEKNPDAFHPESFANTTMAVQSSPLGMGDAIFGAADSWREFDDLLIVWGDQFNLSLRTLRACIDLHGSGRKPALTLPVIRMPRPYVEYVFNASGALTQIRQSREGDVCEPGGFSDVGVFLLSGGEALIKEWTCYRSGGTIGSVTGEINFLPFLAHLSSIGWRVNRYETDDPAEAVGINTAEDLAFARQLLREKLVRHE